MHCWNKLVDNYLLDLKLYKRKAATISAYKTHLQRFVTHLQNATPHRCTRADVLLAFRNVFNLEEKSYNGYGSRRLFTAIIHTFLRWCRENKLIPVFPLRLTFSDTNTHTRKTTAITKDDINKLLDTIRSSPCKNKLRDETLIATYAFTGIRRSEALILRVDAYDMQEQTISLRNKGGKLKCVPVIPSLAKTLRLYIDELTAPHIEQNRNQYLFPGRAEDSHLSLRQANNIFNKWKQIANLPKNLTIHSFRSGFATILYSCSKDMLLVSKALHHRDVRTTAEYIDIQAGIPDLVLSAFASSTSSQPNFNQEISA